ncbi:MAG: CHAD domain-containing protein [Pseudomonadota bacterium]
MDALARQTAAPIEIELKLHADPDVLSRLRRSRVIKRLTQGAPDTSQLLTTYYDTPDFALRRAGVSLRVRREEGRLTQTVKRSAGPASGKLKRFEFETELDDKTPWPAPAPDPEAQRLIGEAVISGRLKPVFRTDVRRITRQIVTEAGDEVELAVDAGEFRCGETDRPLGPIAEIELELVKGDPASLYRIAEPLAEAYRVRLGVEAKADRGYRLLEGRAPAAVKAKRPKLSPDMAAEDAFAAFLESASAQLLANVDVVLDASAPEGVHQMRVALRRLRAAGALYRGAVDMKQMRPVYAEARRLARVLGRARDLDVFTVETLEPMRAAKADEPMLEELASRAAAARRKAWREAREAVGGREFTQFALSLSRTIDERGWRSQRAKKSKALNAPAPAFAKRALGKRWRLAMARGADLDALSLPQRHELRIELKKLRYASDFFASLFPKEPTALFRRRLSGLQDDLGAINDARVAAELAGELAHRGDDAQLVRAAGFITGWRAQMASLRWEDTKTRWAEFIDTPAFWAE